MGQPLDNAKAAFYGRFVLGAYAMHDRDCANLTPEPQAGDIPDPYELFAWIHMCDFAFGVCEPKFYGMVAQNKNAAGDFILAIRGTEGCVEWWDDASAYMVPFSEVPHAGRVAHGFDKIYSTLKLVPHPTLQTDPEDKMAALPPLRLEGSLLDQLDQLHSRVEQHRAMKLSPKEAAAPQRSYVVTGHSLGSALSTLFVMENKQKHKVNISTLCTFASPRVGNMLFARLFNQLPINSWRIANCCDIVPKLPLRIPLILDYEHVNTEYRFDSSAMGVQSNPVCRHSMATHLHWLDPSFPIDAGCKR